MRVIHPWLKCIVRGRCAAVSGTLTGMPEISISKDVCIYLTLLCLCYFALQAYRARVVFPVQDAGCHKKRRHDNA